MPQPTKKENKTKNNMKIKALLSACGMAGAVIISASLLAGTVAFADEPSSSDNSCLWGKSLADWQDTYWRWYYGTLTLPTDPNSNAESDGVVLMALPNAPGEGTPGSIAVTLNAGQSFFLPFQALAGTSYTDGTPPDPLVSFSTWKAITFKLILDGRQIMNLRDALQTYVQFNLDPPIVFDSRRLIRQYGSKALASCSRPCRRASMSCIWSNR